MNEQLTEQDFADSIKEHLVETLITRRHPKFPDFFDFDFYHAAQIAGILNMNPKTLSKLPIAKYPMPGGKLVYYRLSEVRAYMQTLRETH